MSISPTLSMHACAVEEQELYHRRSKRNKLELETMISISKCLHSRLSNSDWRQSYKRNVVLKKDFISPQFTGGALLQFRFNYSILGMTLIYVTVKEFKTNLDFFETVFIL